MRYRITTVLLVFMVIAIGFQISFVSAASIVEWKADYKDWSQEKQKPITTVNTEGQVAIKETLYITNSHHMVVSGSDNQAKNDLEEQQGVGSPDIGAYVHYVFLPLVVSGDECTVLLGPGSIDYDGRDVSPGAIICLNSGTYSKLWFQNLHGTATKPITIRNHGGLVHMNHPTNQVKFDECKHIHFTGSGVASIEYGIKVIGRVKVRNLSTDFEIDHIETYGSEVGMLIGDGENAGHRMRNIYIHHNYLHDHRDEALYVGLGECKEDPEHYLLENVEIAYNTVVAVGEGIQTTCIDVDCKVHHNYIEDVNQSAAGDPCMAGIAINKHCDATVYNNEIRDSEKHGIQIDLNSEYGIKVYNNLIVNVGHAVEGGDGIKVFSDDTDIYNNTIVTTGDHGIDYSNWANNNEAYNNIILDTVKDPIEEGGSPDENFRHNRTKEDGYTSASFGFVDLAYSDYHLTEGSPAVDAGADSGLRWDLDDRPRPVGAAYDIGAYEFAGSLPTPTPTNPPTPTNTPSPTATSTPLPTSTPTFAPTNTPTPTPTSTPTATNTPLPTYTPRPTSTSMPSPTNTPTPTPTETPPLPTWTPTATNTPLPTYTPTPTPSSTPTPVNTPTPTNTPDPTATSTPLPTDTPTFATTNTPTPTSTTSIPTETPSPTWTPTATNTPLPTYTSTPTSTDIPSP